MKTKKKMKNKRVYLLCQNGYLEGHPLRGQEYVGELYELRFRTGVTHQFYRLYRDKDSSYPISDAGWYPDRFQVITPQKFYAIRRKQQAK